MVFVLISEGKYVKGKKYMKLTDEQKRMLDGNEGPGIKKCLDLLVKWGESFDAEKMVKVYSVHLSTNYCIEFLEEWSEGAKRTKCLSTLHAVFDPIFWIEKMGLKFEKNASVGGGILSTDPLDFKKRMGKLKSLGFLPTFTCAPYNVGNNPRQNNICCWVGSSGQIISNSIFGALSGRESVSTCFAAALTGYTPRMGLLDLEKRRAQLLIKVPTKIKTETWTEADYGTLGYFIGGIAGQRNVAIEGLSPDLPMDMARMLLSPQPVSGAVAICKIIGLSPGALTLEEAFARRPPEEVIEVNKSILQETQSKLNNAIDKDVEAVFLGCPHLNLTELLKITTLLEGKRIHPDVMLFIGTSNATKVILKEAGFLDIIEQAGAHVTNACFGPFNPLIYSKNPPKITATNSARSSHYLQTSSGGKIKVLYGDMIKCINAALKGKWEK